jgi:F-type H+-transporting ATPase subunit epsilon
MADRLTLRILLPTREAVSRKVDSVNLPGSEGELGILPGHAPLLAMLRPGAAWFKDGAEIGRLALGDGFLEVKDDVVTAMVQTAERAEDIDVARAERRRAEVDAKLRRDDLEAIELERARISMMKQLARLEVARGALQG